MSLKEAELMWIRFSAMLYASTGLIGVLSFALERQLQTIALGCIILGLIFSIVWIQQIRLSPATTIKDGRWMLTTWLARTNNFVIWFGGRINPRLNRPAKWAASRYAMALPISFATGWATIGAGLLGLFPL